MKKIALIVLIALIIVTGCFYFALRGTTRDVSQLAPYANILNKQLHTNTKTVLARNLEQFHQEEINFITEDEQLFEGVEPIAILPANTKIMFTKAIHYRNGVSGVTHSLLIGKVWVDSLHQEFSFEYTWGNHHFICLEEPCKYWTFPKAIWQTEAESVKYFIE